MTRSNIFKIIRTLIGFFVAFFLLRFVIKSNGVNLEEVWLLIDKPALLAAFVIYGTGFLVAAYRWYLLLRYIQVFLPLSVVVRLALIGQFFNLFVPGGVGGDLIKMVYLKQESGDRYPEALLTVLLDRVIGLAGLLLIGLVAVAFNPSVMLDSSKEMRAILAVVVLSGAAGLLVALMFVLWPYLGRFAGLMQRLRRSVPSKLDGILDRVLSAMSILRSAPSVVVKLLLMAMAGHFFATISIFVVARGVGGAQAVSFQELLLATQLSNLVGAVPLTPGGLGGRDLALSFLMGIAGATDEAKGAIPLVVTGMLIAWSAIGGLALLWERRKLHDDGETTGEG